MMRKAEVTVRLPVARMAPMAKICAWAQTRSENSGAKAAKRTTISGGNGMGVASLVR